MPLLLALDTTTRRTGLILWRDGVLGQREFTPPHTAGSQLLPTLDEMLKAQGLQASDLDVVALANGPGSFTGLRIGLATAKGLVYGGRAELVPVSTLEVLARQAPVSHELLCPVVEARRGEVFTAVWRREAAGLDMLVAPRRVEIANLASELPAGALLIGPALSAQREAFAQAAPGLHLAPDQHCQLSLPCLAELALRRWQEVGGTEPDELEPDYLFEFTPTPGKVRM